MRSNKTKQNWHRISPSGNKASQLVEIGGISTLIDIPRKVVTILQVEEGIDIAQVMFKTYRRLARAGFTFELAMRQHLPTGSMNFIQIARERAFWEVKQEGALGGETVPIEENPRRMNF